MGDKSYAKRYGETVSFSGNFKDDDILSVIPRIGPDLRVVRKWTRFNSAGKVGHTYLMLVKDAEVMVDGASTEYEETIDYIMSLITKEIRKILEEAVSNVR